MGHGFPNFVEKNRNRSVAGMHHMHGGDESFSHPAPALDLSYSFHGLCAFPGKVCWTSSWQKVEMRMESTRVILLQQAQRRMRAAVQARDCPLADALVAATVQGALQVAKGHEPLAPVVSAGAMHLVRDALQALCEDRWRLTARPVAGPQSRSPET
jgi:hypothetical protein